MNCKAFCSCQFILLFMNCISIFLVHVFVGKITLKGVIRGDVELQTFSEEEAADIHTTELQLSVTHVTSITL